MKKAAMVKKAESDLLIKELIRVREEYAQFNKLLKKLQDESLSKEERIYLQKKIDSYHDRLKQRDND